MRASNRPLAWILPLVVFVCLPLLSLGEDPPDETGLVTRIRKSLKIPSQYKIKLGPAETTGVEGLIKRTIAVSGGPKSRSDTLYLSRDSRFLFWGRLLDLEAEPPSARFNDIPTEGHPSLGPPDARITIIEYSDFQCPYCERAYWTVKYKLLRRYDGLIRLVYKDFPLSRLHPWAMKAAIAAQCAFEQGDDPFWKLHDRLFEHQDEITAENIDSKLSQFAADSGIDLETFKGCSEGQATHPRVEASLAEARELGLTGTPAFIVNGQLLRGAPPFSAFKAIIDRELSAAPTATRSMVD